MVNLTIRNFTSKTEVDKDEVEYEKQNTILGGKLGMFASKDEFLAQEGEKLRKSVLSDLSEKNFPLVSAFAFLKQKKTPFEENMPSFSPNAA